MALLPGKSACHCPVALQELQRRSAEEGWREDCSNALGVVRYLTLATQRRRSKAVRGCGRAQPSLLVLSHRCKPCSTAMPVWHTAKAGAHRHQCAFPAWCGAASVCTVLLLTVAQTIVSARRGSRDGLQGPTAGQLCTCARCPAKPHGTLAPG